MIINCKKKIPFHWMLMALLPWSAPTINRQVAGKPVASFLKKFLENPSALTFVLSLPAALSLIVITISNFLSDRVWTRYGRRKPFVLAGFAGTAICFFLMPLMPNFWSSVGVEAADERFDRTYGFWNSFLLCRSAGTKLEVHLPTPATAALLVASGNSPNHST